MAEVENKNNNYQIVNGFKIPRTFSAERFLSTLKYHPRDDDVFLVTYPRSGTTWTHQILHLIFHNGNPPKDGKEFMTSCPFMEMLGAEAAVNAPRPCALKLHLPYHLTPYNPKAKYIYVTRNPKDCCVSFYHFVGKTVDNVNIPFDDFFEKFISGDISYGDYFDNVLSWYEHKNEPNMLFLTYEEMKRDLPAVLRQLCNFLGGDYAEMIKSEDAVKKIVQYSAFNFMKTTVNDNLSGLIDKPDGDKNIAGLKEVWAKREMVKKDKQFVRKGEIGDWRNHLSDDQNRRMNEKIHDKLKSTGLIDIWMAADAI